MFKRRTPRSYAQIVGEAFYPRGGWTRAAWYVVHRLRRLPDPAHRISRGIFAGVFASFTPLFGFHFLIAAVVAWAIRGNILAALLATFAGNPITFPIIATVSVELGSWMMGKPPVPLPKIFVSFSQASGEIWANVRAIFTSSTAEWGRLSYFFSDIFLPYLIGGIIPGIIAGLVAYWLSNPIIASYQRGRIRRLKERFEKRREAAEAARGRKIEAIEREFAGKADRRTKTD